MPFDQSMTQDIDFIEDLYEDEEEGEGLAPSPADGPRIASAAPNRTTVRIPIPLSSVSSSLNATTTFLPYRISVFSVSEPSHAPSRV